MTRWVFTGADTYRSAPPHPSRNDFARLYPVESLPAGLLPDAEPAEDAVEQVVGINCPDHLSNLIEGEPQFQRKQFGRLVEQGGVVGIAQVGQPLLDVMPAPAQARGQGRGAG